jgi:hypothetical protein
MSRRHLSFAAGVLALTATFAWQKPAAAVGPDHTGDSADHDSRPLTAAICKARGKEAGYRDGYDKGYDTGYNGTGAQIGHVTSHLAGSALHQTVQSLHLVSYVQESKHDCEEGGFGGDWEVGYGDGYNGGQADGFADGTREKSGVTPAAVSPDEIANPHRGSPAPSGSGGEVMSGSGGADPNALAPAGR